MEARSQRLDSKSSALFFHTASAKLPEQTSRFVGLIWFSVFRMQNSVSAAISTLVAEQKVQHKKQCELDNLVTILCEQNAKLMERVTDLENERQKREVFTEKILLPAIAKFVAETDPEPLDQFGLRTVFASLKE